MAAQLLHVRTAICLGLTALSGPTWAQERIEDVEASPETPDLHEESDGEPEQIVVDPLHGTCGDSKGEPTERVELYGEEFPASESVTYVMDRSGSMSWGSSYFTGPDGSTQYGTLMDRAKLEVNTSIEYLDVGMRFNVVGFNCSVHTLWSCPQPATNANKEAAQAWVQSQSAYGATGSGPAVVAALTTETEQVILLSDGQPNCPYSMSDHEGMMVSAADGRKVSAIGIGDYGSFAQFLQRVAASTGGSYLHVD
jgi:hypothetical protein